MALSLSKKDARKVKRLMAHTRTCLLCQTFPAQVAGIFQPQQPELWGGQPGKVRLIGYALCGRCYALPNLALHVEARLMADLVGRGN